jgi:hypothetical protein
MYSILTNKNITAIAILFLSIIFMLFSVTLVYAESDGDSDSGDSDSDSDSNNDTHVFWNDWGSGFNQRFGDGGDFTDFNLLSGGNISARLGENCNGCVANVQSYNNGDGTWNTITTYTLPDGTNNNNNNNNNNSTPSCVSNYQSACTSSANICGDYTNGTVLCNGLCSVTTAPALSSTYGQSCISAINICGDIAYGSKQCDGSCSVGTPPAVPAGGCPGGSCAQQTGMSCKSATNSCGDSAWGVFLCDGVTCSADVPPVPANGCGTSVPPTNYPDVTDFWIKADPQIVRYGENATISWDGGNAGACTVTGYDLSAHGVTGSEEVTNMTGEALYTLTCTLGSKSASATATVKVLPRVQET